MHYAVTPLKEPILPWLSEMEKPQGFVPAGMRFTSVKASDRQEASLGRVINQFRWCDGVATAQANHTMDATR